MIMNVWYGKYTILHLLIMCIALTVLYAHDVNTNQTLKVKTPEGRDLFLNSLASDVPGNLSVTNIHSKKTRWIHYEKYESSYMRNTIPPTDSRYNGYGKNVLSPKLKLQACIFHFTDEKSLNETIKEMEEAIVTPIESSDAYFFYVHLEPDESIPPNKDELLTNRVFEWQIVTKKESIIMQLPVDLDLITFDLLESDEEELNIWLTLSTSNHNCTINDSPPALRNVRSLLWTKLLYKFKDLYLCNRKYDALKWNEIIYYLTTIWVGYNMECYTTDKWMHEDISVTLKDIFPYNVPIVCFYISLQFVWLCFVIETFVIGEDKDENDCMWSQMCPFCNETNTKREHDHMFAYKRNDRPYGIARTIIKLFHYKLQNCCKCIVFKLLDIPSFRFCVALWAILLYFNYKRSVERYYLNTREFHEYKHALRASEPACNDLYLDKSILDCDISYAICGSLFGVFLFMYNYHFYTVRNFKLFSVSRPYQKMDHNNVCDRFLARIDIVFALLWDAITCAVFCKRNNNEGSVERVNSRNQPVNDGHGEDTYKRVCIGLFIVLGKIGKYIILLLEIILQVIVCCIPILSFIFNPCFLAFRHIYCKKCNDIKKYGVAIISIVLFCLTVVTFRPIISAFTFILRSVTYMVFVVLPIRQHLLRYFIIVLTTIAYTIGYYIQIVTLFKEILNYVFHIKNDPDNISQEMYSYVLYRLAFVKGKIYFFFIKSILICLYLIITIETIFYSGKSKSHLETKDIIEYTLILISPYFISYLFKTDDNKYLSTQHEDEIRKLVEEFEALPKCANPSKAEVFWPLMQPNQSKVESGRGSRGRSSLEEIEEI